VVVAGFVELAEAVGATGTQTGGQTDADRHSVTHQLVGPSSLPDEGPGGDDDELSREENGGGDYQSRHVYAEAGLVRHEDGFAVDGLVHVAFETELIGDLDRLDEEQVVLGGAGRATSPTSSVGHHGTEVTGGLLLVALDGLAVGHAGGDECAELDHLR
jgi:hypothetical protein